MLLTVCQFQQMTHHVHSLVNTLYVPSAWLPWSTNCSGLFVVQTRTLSLIVQSYQPREMNSGLLNADGFGVGWYHLQRDTDPFTYKIYSPSGMTLTF